MFDIDVEVVGNGVDIGVGWYDVVEGGGLGS